MYGIPATLTVCTAVSIKSCFTSIALRLEVLTNANIGMTIPKPTKIDLRIRLSIEPGSYTA